MQNYLILPGEDFHAGTKYTTPRRLAWHVTGNPDDPVGVELGKRFDALYTDRVNVETVPLFAGMKELVLEMKDTFVSMGVLSNSCTDYVQRVIETHNLTSLFSVIVGSDEVPEAKPLPGEIEERER